MLASGAVREGRRFLMCLLQPSQVSAQQMQTGRAERFLPTFSCLVPIQSPPPPAQWPWNLTPHLLQPF